MRRILAALALSTIFKVSAVGQGFLNLDFESAYGLPGNPGHYGTPVAVTDALPGWNAYNGDSVLADVYYISNSFPGGSSTSIELEGGSLALSGDFSVGLYLAGGISQTGSVADDAESLQFEAEGPGPGGSLAGTGFTVTLGGQTLSYSALSQGPDYILYGANIPAGMDGQMEALTFYGGSGNILLDNIVFSTSSVPEPAECALIGVGVVLFGAWRRHGRIPNNTQLRQGYDGQEGTKERSRF